MSNHLPEPSAESELETILLFCKIQLDDTQFKGLVSLLSKRDEGRTALQIKTLEGMKPSNELIQQSLQSGKPQQAASYNGYSAGIDAAINLLKEGTK